MAGFELVEQTLRSAVIWVIGQKIAELASGFPGQASLAQDEGVVEASAGKGVLAEKATVEAHGVLCVAGLALDASELCELARRGRRASAGGDEEFLVRILKSRAKHVFVIDGLDDLEQAPREAQVPVREREGERRAIEVDGQEIDDGGGTSPNRDRAPQFRSRLGIVAPTEVLEGCGEADLGIVGRESPAAEDPVASGLRRRDR